MCSWDAPQAPGRPLVEYLVDDVLMRPIVADLLGRPWVEESGDRETQKAYLDNFIQFWYRLGYDFVRFERSLGFPVRQLHVPDTAPGSQKQRAWTDEHRGSITTWEDFERYPWPTVEAMDFFPFEYLNSHLPEGMGLMTCHAAGVFEHLSQIMSYEGLCLALYDSPDLVQAISDRVGELMVGFYRHLLDLDRVIAIFPGDDMGFRTGTLIAPDDLRRYCLPWHKRFAAMTHERGLPYFLHSCGNLTSDHGGPDQRRAASTASTPSKMPSSRSRNSRRATAGVSPFWAAWTWTSWRLRRRSRYAITHAA